MTTSAKMVPPQNIEAEQAVLGTILLQDNALLKVAEILSPEDFYRDAHKIIYEAMVALFEKKEPHDLITVSNLLSDQNRLSQIGGAAYLASLTDVIPFTGTLVHHANIIRKKAILRRLIQTSSEVAARCYDAQDDIETLVDEAEQVLTDRERVVAPSSQNPVDVDLGGSIPPCPWSGCSYQVTGSSRLAASEQSCRLRPAMPPSALSVTRSALITSPAPQQAKTRVRETFGSSVSNSLPYSNRISVPATGTTPANWSGCNTASVQHACPPRE